MKTMLALPRVIASALPCFPKPETEGSGQAPILYRLAAS